MGGVKVQSFEMAIYLVCSVVRFILMTETESLNRELSNDTNSMLIGQVLPELENLKYSRTANTETIFIGCK